MSSDLRLKKLRGSGGYVMASVTDEQQRKGNLGGPDLFLAPIGRIANEKITKFFCNTCERDYEGSPKIEFENPNEEVAENLILVEKGQYICSTCGSTLAEYRDFKKPDEAVEVGIAKPIESTMNTFETPAESFTPTGTNTIVDEPVFEPPTASIPEETPSIEPSIPDFGFQESSTAPQPEIKTQPQGGINAITGMAVYDENAKRIGTAKQVGVDASQSLVLVVTTNDGSEISLPWNQIKKVGEIVLVGDTSGATQSTPAQTQSSGCPSCGFTNKPGSKFCEECGTKL